MACETGRPQCKARTREFRPDGSSASRGVASRSKHPSHERNLLCQLCLRLFFEIQIRKAALMFACTVTHRTLQQTQLLVTPNGGSSIS